jgi:hypothetical protein
MRELLNEMRQILKSGHHKQALAKMDETISFGECDPIVRLMFQGSSIQSTTALILASALNSGSTSSHNSRSRTGVASSRRLRPHSRSPTTHGNTICRFLPGWREAPLRNR